VSNGCDGGSWSSLLNVTKRLRGPKLRLLIGLSIVLLFVMLSILAPVVAPYGPTEINLSERLQPPSRTHLMGTDEFGRDILSRVLFGGRADLVIAVCATLLSMAIGVPLGAFIGYGSKIVDEVVMRIADSMNAFPAFILALLIVSVLGPGILNIIIVVAIVNCPSYVRLVRGQVLALKELEFVEAARSIGASRIRIIFRHLLPNTMGPVLILANLNAAWAVLTAAGLSFIGVGISPPTPEWGLMVQEGTRYLPSGEWWLSFFPGLAITLLVVGFNFIGENVKR